MSSPNEYVGIGYVVADKLEDSNVIKVYPIELIPTAVGELDYDEDITTELKNILGDDIVVRANKSRFLEPYWLNDNQSRDLLAPDVCKGEIVKLYNLKNTDVYQWETLFTATHLRKREKRLIYISNKDSITDEEDLSTGYFMLMDSINKQTIYHMSDNDGEFTSYTVSIDGAIGSFLIADGRDNKVELVSHKDNLDINVGNDVNITCGNDANINTTGNTNVTADGEVVVKGKMIRLN